MIKFCFLFLLAGMMLSCHQKPETTIGIHMEGIPADKEVRVATRDTTYVSILDSMGSAKILLAEHFNPGYALLSYGKFQLPLYVEPAKSFEVDVRFEGYRATPVFTGEGAQKNIYLNCEHFRQFQPDYKAEEETFMALLEEQLTKFNQVLDSMAFDASFSQLEKRRIHYLVYSALPNYPYFHAYYAQDKDYVPSEKYYTTLQNAVPEEEDLVYMQEYRSALRGAVVIIATREMDGYNGLEYTKKQLDYVCRQIKSPVLADFLVDQIVMEYVRDSGIDDLDQMAPVYQAKVNSPEKKAEFDKLCEKWARLAKGQPAVGFKYPDINGKEVSLVDLAGKYVYIDVWATWCGPCRRELPYLKDLEQQLQKKNISFVSISCDQNKEAWQKMVKEEKLGGIQLHNGGDREFMEAYMIRSIPRFILLDREGKIITARMSRPSDPKTLETLKALEGI